jgi:hypothetical protein
MFIKRKKKYQLHLLDRVKNIIKMHDKRQNKKPKKQQHQRWLRRKRPRAGERRIFDTI